MTGEETSFLHAAQDLLSRPRAGDADELTAIDEVLASAPAELGPQAAIAMVDLLSRKASAQARLWRYGDAIGTLDDVVSRFRPPPDWRLAHAVGWALMTKCKLLLSTNRETEAESVCAELLALFAKQPESRDLSGFGEMLLEVGGAFASHRNYERALAIWGTVTARLMEAPNAREEVVAAKAEFTIVTALHNLHRPDAAKALEAFCAKGETALNALDDIVANHPPRRGSATASFLLIARVLILIDLGRRNEADDLLQELDLDGQGSAELRAELHSELRRLLT